jgi:hypothetical protein
MLEDTYSIGRKGILATPQNPLIIIASHKKQRGHTILSPAGNLLYYQQPSLFLHNLFSCRGSLFYLAITNCHLLLAVYCINLFHQLTAHTQNSSDWK